MYYFVGIDEAGRGPLAGPVAVGIARLPHTFNKRHLKGIKDSKKLSPQQRELWFEKMKQWQSQGLMDFAVSLISASVIDSKGISQAIKQGMKNCLRKVKAQPADYIFLDGGLKAPLIYIEQETIIKGDEKIPAISLASIAAKVTRDKYMTNLASKKKYEHYQFHIHKGYGTQLHRNLIKKHGACDIHRTSFLGRIL